MDKIPNFPKFKKLELSDKVAIEKFTNKYTPYADYNFISLYTWDIKGDALISQLNNNLVIKYHDYVTQEPFYSFLGTNEIVKTSKTLLKFSEKNGLRQKLQLIPEIVAKNIHKSSELLVEEDPDNHDYIFSVEKLTTMAGNKLGPKRNFINRFKRKYNKEYRIQFLDLSKDTIAKQVIDLFVEWEVKEKKSSIDTKVEFEAIKKLLNSADKLELHAFGIFIKGKLVAFSIDEVLTHGYGVIHFEKADINYVGIYAFLKQQTALMLEKYGCKYINYEQDLGIEGLRKAKQSFRPVQLLKKYVITPKSWDKKKAGISTVEEKKGCKILSVNNHLAIM